jgi:thioredoxin-related protein
MMNKILSIMIVVLLFLGLQAAAASEPQWETDFEAARAKALSAGKDLLLNFTGTDWCPWCKKLKQEVFDHEVFVHEASKNFVFVELDFPNKKKLPEELVKQNKGLQEKYGVKGYPTVLLTDVKGRVFARTGYRPGGAKKYLVHLKELRTARDQREDLLSRAEKAGGIEKARLLDSAVATMAKSGLDPDPKMINEIKDLDRDNKAGLKSKYEIAMGVRQIRDELDRTRNFAKALKDVDELITKTDPPPEVRQDLLFLKARVHMDGMKDMSAGIEVLKQARDLDPGSEKGKALAAIVIQLETQQKSENRQADLLARAEKAKGLDRARLLDQALDMMAGEGASRDKKMVAEVRDLDRDNRAGLKAKYDIVERVDQINLGLKKSKDADKFDKALKELDALKAGAKDWPVIVQDICLFKAAIYLHGKKDKDTGIKYLKDAVAAAPDTLKGKRLAEHVKQLEKMNGTGPGKKEKP